MESAFRLFFFFVCRLSERRKSCCLLAGWLPVPWWQMITWQQSSFIHSFILFIQSVFAWPGLRLLLIGRQDQFKSCKVDQQHNSANSRKEYISKQLEEAQELTGKVATFTFRKTKQKLRSNDAFSASVCVCWLILSNMCAKNNELVNWSYLGEKRQNKNIFC